MSAVPKRKMTEAEYLDLERKAEFKSEFWNGDMYPLQGPLAIAGARYTHNRIKDNLVSLVNNELEGGRCFALTSDMKVKVVSTGLVTYPDVLVVCGEPVFLDESEDVLLNPVMVFEVLSDSTESYDRGKKFGHYRQIETLKEYLLISTNHQQVEHFVKQRDGSWKQTVYDEAEFPLRSIKLRVTMKRLYAGVTIPPEERLR